MDITIELIIYLILGIVIGHIIAYGGVRGKSIAITSTGSGTLVLVEENGDTHISSDRGSSWCLTGKWK